jgi:hypothetical protein
MNRLTTYPGLHALAATAILMTDTTGGLGTLGAPANPATPAPAPTLNPVFTFELPHLTGERSLDVTSIPQAARMDLLQGAARTYLANRVNIAHQRYIKDDKVAAWTAYDEAVKTDPFTTKPEGERPAAPDLEAVYAKALSDLQSGNIKRQGDGGKTRERKDPLLALITKTVVKDVYETTKGANPKYTYLNAQKDVGPDGLAYLNKLIDAKVAQGVDRAALEKMREEKYVNPSKLLLGMTENKKLKDLPSIL